jgi:predicted transcriptional regulator
VVFKSIMEHNELKYYILDLLSDDNVWTSFEVSKALQISFVNASNALHRYFKQGILRRRKISKNGTYGYTISEKGLERLKWLRIVFE